ncbi:MAG: hypothetical protein U0Q14_02385 [Dermatophilaceae bacterium]
MTDIPNTPPSPDGTEPFPTVTPDSTPELSSSPPAAAFPPPNQGPTEGALPPPYQAPADSPFAPVEVPPASAGLFGSPIVKWVVGLAVAALVGLGFSWYSNRNDPQTAAVGDCIQKVGDSDAKKVDCSSPDAQFKVLAKVTNVKRSSTTEDLCADQPTVTHSLWQGQSDKDDAIGFALCLEEIAK